MSVLMRLLALGAFWLPRVNTLNLSVITQS